MDLPYLTPCTIYYPAGFSHFPVLCLSFSSPFSSFLLPTVSWRFDKRDKLRAIFSVPPSRTALPHYPFSWPSVSNRLDCGQVSRLNFSQPTQLVMWCSFLFFRSADLCCSPCCFSFFICVFCHIIISKNLRHTTRQRKRKTVVARKEIHLKKNYCKILKLKYWISMFVL